MKKQIFHIAYVIIILLASCSPREINQQIENSADSETPNKSPSMSVVPTTNSSLKSTILPTTIPIASATPQPTIPRTQTIETVDTASLEFPCVNLNSKLPMQNKGFIWFEKYQPGNSVLTSNSYLLNVTNLQITQVNHPNENLVNLKVSPDRRRIAYVRQVFDQQENLLEKEFIIANSEGAKLFGTEWNKDWEVLSGWLDNKRIAIQLSSADPEVISVRKPGLTLVLDILSGERYVIGQEYPQMLYDPSIALPFWDGWNGVIYDPTFTLAVYPRYVPGDREQMTYGIWDLSKQKPVASLDNVFQMFTVMHFFPTPRWSPDGSKFAFIGVLSPTDQNSPRPKFELHLVNRSGQVERLTDLSDKAYIWPSSLSWSTDGHYLAMMLGPALGASDTPTRLAVLDTTTKAITYYCAIINTSGEEAPIWSPEGHKLLINDRYEKEHNNVILVDIDQGVAIRIAEDMDPIGWMAEPNH